MKTSASLLACLLLHYTASPMAQIYHVTDHRGHAQFTDQCLEVHRALASITVIQDKPIDYQAPSKTIAPTISISDPIEQHKAKNALHAHLKQQRYLIWRQQLIDKISR